MRENKINIFTSLLTHYARKTCDVICNSSKKQKERLENEILIKNGKYSLIYVVTITIQEEMESEKESNPNPQIFLTPLSATGMHVMKKLLLKLHGK